MSRIVSNLLANAIRHAPVGGRVRCALTRRRRRRGAEVADSGPGVPPEHRDRVFGRFRSGLDGDGRSAGAGAGPRPGDRARVRRAARRRDLARRRARGRRAVHRHAAAAPARTASRVAATLAQHAAAAQRTEYVRSHLEAELAGEPRQPRVPTVVIVERVPGPRRRDPRAASATRAVTCVAEDALEALRLAVELRPDAVVVGTATGDMPATSLLRRLAADERLSACAASRSPASARRTPRPRR